MNPTQLVHEHFIINDSNYVHTFLPNSFNNWKKIENEVFAQKDYKSIMVTNNIENYSIKKTDY